MSIPIHAVETDQGTGYTRKRVDHEGKLTEVGRGTPMGELLRRYWHPVGLASHATSTPREVRVLGEDLVLFRDLTGQPGLLHARCCHRGTSLFYGKVNEQGLRCCYHGWLFDAQGRCLKQPCEPDAGAAFRGKVRQPWYPVQERYGLIFAYMGPLWWGIVNVTVIMIGLFCPPIGLNVMVIQGLIRDLPLRRIYVGVMPYLLADFMRLALLVLFPAIATWLPSALR